MLRNGKTCAVMLESQDVYLLTQAFHEHACSDAADLLNFTDYKAHAYPCQGWPLTVLSSLDWFARKVASSVMDYANCRVTGPVAHLCHEHGRLPQERRTLDLRVAISMRWDPPPPP